MRPLKLIIEGFGTYCKKTEINLESLGTSGLYLITGDTGSGKTTIFDAITYALYGSVNGKNRDVSMIRSTFATPDIPTRIELVFEYRDKIYRIIRNPEYERRSKRGDSLTKQTADAVLEYPDGSVVTQNLKVTQAVTELLGIDAIQFSKIVMIAQGDFQQLLVDNTEERQKIFRKIFKTTYYQKLEEKLSEKEKELAGKCSDIRKKQALFINQAVCADTSTNTIELEKAKDGALSVEQILELLEKIIKEDSEQKHTLEAQIKQQEQELNKITALLAKNEEQEKHRTDYEQKKQELNELSKTAELAQKEFEKQKALTGERQKKEADCAVQKERLSSYEKLEQLEKEKDGDTQDLEQKQAADNELIREIELCENKRQTLSDKLKQLSDCDQKAIVLTNKKEKLEEKIKQLEILEEKINLAQQLNENYKVSKEQYKLVMERWNDLEEKYRQLRKVYMDEQAGILAEELEENAPCPVCGSLTHPCPAKKSESAPTQEELDSAEQAAQAAKAESDAANEACVKNKADYENLEKTIAEEIARLFEENQKVDSSLLCSKKEELEKELSSVNQELENENARSEQKQSIEKELPSLEKELEKNKETSTKLKSELSAIDARIKEYDRQLKELRGTLEYESKALADAALKELEEQIARMKQAFDTAQENDTRLKSQTASLNAEIKQLEQMLKEAEKINIEELLQKQEALVYEKDNASEIKGIVDTRLDRNAQVMDNIKKTSGELAALEKEFQSVSALSKTANGMLTGGKEKIRLETYIQMTYFDRIIAHANKRLMIMSDMQYELVRKTEPGSLKSQTGLELDVIDHYNGGQRSVKSLSGGETFEASLSLALGLSDEVRLSAGGIKIDSMFVDEGFGTLDSESLQKAFKALSGITEENRLVGIISHVDQLKEKIDRQIVVKKERTGGSTVNVVV